MRVRSFITAGAALLFAGACGGSVFSNDQGEGGSSSQGGSAERGGNGSNGGAAATEGGSGNRSSGGSSGSSGANGKGGTSTTGGNSGGGKGGTSSSGGKGGTSSTGSASSAGGTTTSGGKGGTSSGGGKGGAGGAVTIAGGSTAVGGSAGTNSGGRAGAGGSSGGSAGSGGNADGLCRTASDCTLSTDCCTCFAAGPGEPTARCKSLCIEPMCFSQSIGPDEVSCIAGRCVLARSCTPTAIMCDQVTPVCPAGEMPSVLNSCWGPCIPVEECSDVPSCDVCTDAGFACATYETQLGPQYHCVSTPPACGDKPSCSCMGVCTGSFMCSAPDSTNLYCHCPNC